jgi:alpha-tubulin suppressor-like RCC1 family protein
LSSGVIALSAGDSHTCALLNNGSVKCWGFNGSGQLGDNSDANSPTPVAVSGLNGGVIAIAASYGHNCAIVSNGTLSRAVKCWGFNETGQLGDLTITYRTAPVEVGGSTGAIAIGAGWGHSCLLTDSGAECWGKNFNGQLGDNTTEFSPGPVDVLWP